MSNAIDIKVPDIGDFSDVPVIEIFVKPGDTVKAEDPLVSLESDKATMEVPAPRGGVVESISVKLGDKVSEGSVIMTFKAEGGAADGDGAVRQVSRRASHAQATEAHFADQHALGNEGDAVEQQAQRQTGQVSRHARRVEPRVSTATG